MRVATVNGYRLDFSQYPRLESYEAAYYRSLHDIPDRITASRSRAKAGPTVTRTPGCGGAGAGGPRGLVRKAARFIPFNSKRRNRFIAYDQNTTHWGRGSWYMDMSMLEPELNWN